MPSSDDFSLSEASESRRPRIFAFQGVGKYVVRGFLLSKGLESASSDDFLLSKGLESASSDDFLFSKGLESASSDDFLFSKGLERSQADGF